MINTQNCTGCYACVNICPKKCISMEIDGEGFWYPKVNYGKCIKCGKCVKVCPALNDTTIQNNPTAYACLNKDESTRIKSSSGGIFTLLAEQIIAEKGVVFGAKFNQNFEVEHSYVETKEKINVFQGSKYVQSKIGKTYEQAKSFLENRKTVLFTGTPCQIGGLKLFLGKNYNNLICVDFICHGVPSPAVWKKYIKHREKNAQTQIQEVYFRDKNEGWKKYSLHFLFKNNKEYRENLRGDPYMIAFLKNICLRPSCHACKFRTLNRQSDVTLADFWGIDNILPELNDNKGVSLIFINSDKGKNIFNQAKSKLLYKEVNIEEAVSYNSSAIKSPAVHPKRKVFFKNIEKLPFDKLVRKYILGNIFSRERIKYLLNRVIKK